MIEPLNLIINKDERALEKKKSACKTFNEVLLKEDLTFAEAFNMLLYVRNYGIVSEELFKYVFDKYKFPVPEIDPNCGMAILTYDGFKVKVPLEERGEGISVVPDVAPKFDMMFDSEELKSARNAALRALHHVSTLKSAYVDKRTSWFDILKNRSYNDPLKAAMAFLAVYADEIESDTLPEPPSYFTMLFQASRVKYINSLTSILANFAKQKNSFVDDSSVKVSQACEEYKKILPAVDRVVKSFDGAFLHIPERCGGWLNDVELMHKIVDSACNM